MTIGSIIKKLRRERDMTQEGLAECLGISAASVSQWECDKTAPDISQLPVLANIFEVTTDYLLGVDVSNREKEIDAILDAARSHTDNAHPERALPILQDGQRRFPTSYKIMLSLLRTYNSCVRQSQIELSGAERELYRNETMRLCKKILAECTDDYIRNGAKNILCYTYEDLGRYEEIMELAKSQPSLCNSREDYQVRAHTGTKKSYYKCQHLISCFDELRYILMRMNTKLDDGSMKYTPEEEIEILKKVLAIADIIFEDGNYGFYRHRVIEALEAIARLYADLGDAEQAIAHLEKAAFHSIICDTKYDPKDKYTCLLLRERVIGGVSHNSTANCCMSLMNEMKAARFDFVRDDPRIVGILAQLEEHAAER